MSGEGVDSGETVTVDGVPLYFLRIGAGPPVVLIHGASGNLRDWTLGAAQAIAAANTVFAFDRPGPGLSGRPPRGNERLAVQAGLIRGGLARLGVGRARLVGHSYGGSVALAWALDAPESVDGMVLLATPSHPGPSRARARHQPAGGADRRAGAGAQPAGGAARPLRHQRARGDLRSTVAAVGVSQAPAATWSSTRPRSATTRCSLPR